MKLQKGENISGAICPRCNGTAIVNGKPCKRCRGTGIVDAVDAILCYDENGDI